MNSYNNQGVAPSRSSRSAGLTCTWGKNRSSRSKPEKQADLLRKRRLNNFNYYNGLAVSGEGQLTCLTCTQFDLLFSNNFKQVSQVRSQVTAKAACVGARARVYICAA